MPRFGAACLAHAHKIRIGSRFAALHIIGRDYVLLIDKLAEVVDQTLKKRTLSAARNDADAHASLLYLAHDVEHPIEDRSRRHVVKDVGFDLVHALSLVERYVPTLLLLDKPHDGVDTPRTFGGVRVGCRHAYAKLRHRLLPCHSMAGHRVVEHAVHIKKHGLGRKPLKAVLLHVLFNFVLEHYQTKIISRQPDASVWPRSQPHIQAC